MAYWGKVAAQAGAILVLFFLITYDFQDSDSFRTWNLPLAGKVVVIDPGHGGPDGGAVG